MSRFIACNGNQTEINPDAPEIIKILPLGHVISQKGEFDVDEDSFNRMKEEFAKRGNDVVIDYEHQTLKDIQAPAGGWIKELIFDEENGAIAAKVEWTPQAKKYIENREYRYLSPVVLVSENTNKAVILHSVALTNTPAIDGMFPIINSINLEDYEGGNNMDIKKLAVMLGLAEDATEEQIMESLKVLLEAAKKVQEKPQDDEEKVVANKVICEMVGLKAGAKTEDVAAAILSLKSTTGAEVSAVEFKALKDKIANQEADAAVQLALKGGKLTPAQKDWAKQYALKDPDGFKSFIEKAPQSVPVGELEFDMSVNKDSQSYDAATMLVCKQLGVSEDDLKKYNKGVK